MDSLSRRLRPALVVLVLASGLLGLSSSQAGAESASSELRAFQGGALDGGDAGTCAVLQSGNVRCWGFGGNGELGYGNTTPIGDTETPGSVGPVDVGTGRTARAISSGTFHSCALLDDGNVRCWGFGSNGALGYGNTTTIGNDPGETPGTVGPVNLGAGRTARAVTAGGSHSCALLDDGNVRCWGAGGNGKLGYGNTTTIGDTETPGSVGPVDLGAGRTARAITAGGSHTCALLDDGNVRCWGEGDLGRLGYANTTDIGDNVGETPGTVGPVDLGAGRTARAITAGDSHTCALLDDGNVRCWGNGADGRLGYGNTTTIGDNVGETPGSVGTVNLGLGRTARAITAGTFHTCALLDDGNVRCWGNGGFGQLGYGNTDTIGDDPGETGTAGPVNLGAGRTARAITAGTVHTCALLDDGNVRCWGANANGELGYGNTTQIGDDPGETGTAGPVALGGPLPAKVADLSLGMTASETSRQVGEQVTLTLTVTNSGPDTLQAHSIAVALPGGLTALSATPSQGYWNATAGRWNPLTLASGASATLAIVAQVNAVGAHRADAAVATSELLDPDSIPLGAFPNPDDRASATVTGAGAVGPTGPTGPAGTDGQDGTDGTNGTDGTDGTIGIPGPTGPAGPAGPQGIAGLATVLGQPSYKARRKRKLRIRYGVSRAAGVTLEIRKGSRTIQRARRQATAGPNTFTITPKRAGRFTLRLTARANGQTARDTAKLRVR